MMGVVGHPAHGGAVHAHLSSPTLDHDLHLLGHPRPPNASLDSAGGLSMGHQVA